MGKKSQTANTISWVTLAELIWLLGCQNKWKTCFLLFFSQRIFKMICVTEVTYMKCHQRRCIQWQIVWNRLKCPFTKRWDQQAMNYKFQFCNNSTYFFHCYHSIGITVLCWWDTVYSRSLHFDFFLFRCCQSNWITGKATGIRRSTSAQATVSQKSASEWVLYGYPRGMTWRF